MAWWVPPGRFQDFPSFPPAAGVPTKKRSLHSDTQFLANQNPGKTDVESYKVLVWRNLEKPIIFSDLLVWCFSSLVTQCLTWMTKLWLKYLWNTVPMKFLFDLDLFDGSMYISEKGDLDMETISTKSDPSCRWQGWAKVFLSLKLFQRCSAQLSESTNFWQKSFTPGMCLDVSPWIVVTSARAVPSQRSKGALASRRPRKKRLFQVLVFHLWLEVRKGPVQTLRSSIFLYKNPGAKQGGVYKFAAHHCQTTERSQWGSAFAWGNWLSLQVEIKHIKDFSRPFTQN